MSFLTIGVSNTMTAGAAVAVIGTVLILSFAGGDTAYACCDICVGDDC